MTNPPSTGRIILAALLVLPVGAAAVQGFDDAVETPSIEYRVEPVNSTDSAKQALGVNERILTCPSHRPCEMERRVLANGSVRYEGHLAGEQRYPAVNIGGEFYLPEHTEHNGSLVLTLRNVSAREAAEAVSVPASELGPEVQTAVREGTVATDGRVSAFEEREAIVAYGGTLYWNDRSHYKSQGINSTEMWKPTTFGTVFALLAVDLYRGVEQFRRER